MNFYLEDGRPISLRLYTVRSQLISGINVNYSDFWHMITKRKNSENHGHFVLNCNFKKKTNNSVFNWQ